MTHNSILCNLDRQTQEIERKVSTVDDPDQLFLLGLDLNKMVTNMDHARGLILELEALGDASISASRALLKKINQRIQLAQHKVQTVHQREAQTYQLELQRKQALAILQSEPGLRNRRGSLNYPASNETKTSSIKTTSTDISLNDKLTVQQNVQEDLSHDILDMVSKIKSNAIAFGEKMAADSDVIRSTGEALNKTAGNMDKVGSRLSKYQTTSALGWRFYIMAVIFLIVAVSGGMIIIRLFPKW